MSKRFLLVVLAAGLLSACSREPFSEEEMQAIAQLRLSQLAPLKPDPSNRFADDPAAAALGEALFFDTRLSRDGTVACATCHLPDRQFQDDLPRGHGIGVSDRRTMPLAGVAHGQWFFWDGRSDSQWAQALTPIEDPREHGFTRAAVAAVIAEAYREQYEAVFGPVPDVEVHGASPLGNEEEQAAWKALGPEEQEAVNIVFANAGKALAAFQRTIAHEETRFDRYAEAIVSGREPAAGDAFNSLEIEGLKLFIGKAGCINCHNGPRFTDDFFHNTGVLTPEGLPVNRGRIDAIDEVLADPFNCLGKYSDASPDDCRELRFIARDDAALVGAFKTPSLRGAASRAPYMHAGQFSTLGEVIDHYSTAPAAPVGTSEIGPVAFTDRGRAALIAFLKTLD